MEVVPEKGDLMINLSKHGLELRWSDDEHRLALGNGARSDSVDIRTKEQMRDVIMHANTKLPEEFYYMYRDVCMLRDWDAIKKDDLKFCITVWPAFSIAGEYNKTCGHFHSKVPGTEYEYPEIYEVIAGKGHFIQQANDGSLFVVVRAKAGDMVVVPPSCGHVTVNAGKTTLLTLDCSARSARSDYGPLKEKRGAMYYDTEKGFVKNRNYAKIPELKIAEPALAKKLGFSKESIYRNYLENPKIMDFLKRPQKFLKEFEM